MKYIVITTKHHDGFAMYDSKVSDFDIMATPFKRDILKELAAECKKEGIQLCFYHSIMDWHHPDYLPRRNWETDRSTKGANFDRYVTYMKKQLKELLTNYGDAPHVLWFDGEWESTWNGDRGEDLYNFVRNLKPDIIINNRVGAHRDGMAGFTNGQMEGDFGTPEQEIPATGLPGVDWESCMTMNDNWGYNKADKNFKSTEELLRNLADIASKGGNFLLNVGPTSAGVFPDESIQRLKEIGDWMQVNGESIHGTMASPIGSFDWGRVTMKMKGENTLFYLHVFDAPKDNKLVLDGVLNVPMGLSFLDAKSGGTPKVERKDDGLVIELPNKLPSKINSVIVLQLKGKPDVHFAPVAKIKRNIFIEKMEVPLEDAAGNVDIHYTTDGAAVTVNSPVYKAPISIHETTTVTARSFRNGKPVSGQMQQTFWKKEALKSHPNPAAAPGLQYLYYEGKWEKLPDFDAMKPLKQGTVTNFDRSAKNQKGEHYGFEYRGFIKIPTTGVYDFTTSSDDGSLLWIDQQKIVDNDGLHGNKKVTGELPLEAGYHEFMVRYFNATGGEDLRVFWASDMMQEQPIPDGVLFHVKPK
jgi:alpha-L-fucosidase